MPLLLSLLEEYYYNWNKILKEDASFKSLLLISACCRCSLYGSVLFNSEGTEIVRHLTGVNESAIEKHADMAKITMVIIAITREPFL